MTVYFPMLVQNRNRVQLLAVQKPIKRQGSWKGKFALFGCQHQDGGDACLKTDVPPDNHGQELLRAEGGGYMEIAQSVLKVILKLVMWWSDQRHLGWLF